jgi:hypothetical protein
MSRTDTRRIACMLLTACIVLAGASARQAARAEDVLTPPLAPLTGTDSTAASRNTFSLVEEDGQLAAACWVASAGSCVCSAGAVEDLLTPDFMRVLLTNWRDAGRLTTREWRERVRELDAACGSQSVTP